MECVFFRYMATKKKHNCNTNIKYGPGVTASQILRPLLAKPRENQKTSRKPKNQKTKTFQRMFGLRLMFGFFLVFLEFFCFFLVMTLKKLKKTQGFFWFFAWIVFTCLLKICPKNQKRPEFFWFFGLLQVRVPSKNQKKTLSFFNFFKVMTKKNKKTRGKQKKTNMSLRPNIL